MVAANYTIPASSKVPEADMIPRNFLEKSKQAYGLFTGWPYQKGTFQVPQKYISQEDYFNKNLNFKQKKHLMSMWEFDHDVSDFLFSVSCTVPGTLQALNRCLRKEGSKEGRRKDDSHVPGTSNVPYSPTAAPLD